MKLLVLGGTVFLGRHIVQAALQRGHQVTLFTRGRHNPDLFPEAEKLVGDRDGNLEPLRGRKWDAAIDTSGYLPRIVQSTLDALRGGVGHYTFISSVSAYADMSLLGMDEDAPLAVLADETSEDINEHYGALKVRCEQAVQQAMPDRALVIRPGLIVGPHDPTDRFTYWPHRVARGGEVLAPGSPGAQAQVIDARDLAEWSVRMVEGAKAAVYNATGPAYLLTMGALLSECERVSSSGADFTWVSEAFLLESGAQPWSEIPLWIPDQMDARGMDAVSSARAIREGLSFRPLADTIRDTLAWDATRPADTKLRAGLTPEREAELLATWHRSRSETERANV